MRPQKKRAHTRITATKQIQISNHEGEREAAIEGLEVTTLEDTPGFGDKAEFGCRCALEQFIIMAEDLKPCFASA
jgi:hypothetical protein